MRTLVDVEIGWEVFARRRSVVRFQGDQVQVTECDV